MIDDKAAVRLCISLVTLLLLVGAFTVGVFLLFARHSPAIKVVRLHEVGEASWAIQGEYSQVDCHNQPDMKPWFMTVDNHEFFMGCRP